MAIDVLQAAKYLAKRSGWRLTRLELQKMVYLAQKKRIKMKFFS